MAFIAMLLNREHTPAKQYEKCDLIKLYFISELYSLIGIAESKRPSSSFYASRYGRSQDSGPANNNLRITPRRDFHFLRYGKRASYHDETGSAIKFCSTSNGYPLICSYTGVHDLFRCRKGYD